MDFAGEAATFDEDGFELAALGFLFTVAAAAVAANAEVSALSAASVVLMVVLLVVDVSPSARSGSDRAPQRGRVPVSPGVSSGRDPTLP